MIHMHWFWRAAIAILAALLWWAVHHFIIVLFFVRMFNPSTHIYVFITANIIYQIVLACICITVYGLLTRRYYKSRLHVDETRCRKCGYILKGITEPRCSECGERI